MQKLSKMKFLQHVGKKREGLQTLKSRKVACLGHDCGLRHATLRWARPRVNNALEERRIHGCGISETGQA